jgi:hypothetical protein
MCDTQVVTLVLSFVFVSAIHDAEEEEGTFIGGGG